MSTLQGNARGKFALVTGILYGVIALAMTLPNMALTFDQDVKGDPYPLESCIVSSQTLGSMGDPIHYDHNGREIRFCCKGCIRKFQSSTDYYISKIDESIIKKQLPFYPTENCLVSDKPLGGEMGEPVNFVHNNRLVRFCCKSCVRGFKKNPQKFLKQLDEGIIKKQAHAYPLKACVVSGEPLGGEMGDPIDKVYNNRLVRLCCKGCIKKFEKEPSKYLALIDAAWSN